MPTVQQSIDVGVGVATAYEQWARFESFPLWMEGVASVAQLGGGRLHWVARVRNQFATVEAETREWDARITEQTPGHRVAWETEGGSPDQKPDSGAASFEPLGGSACRVTFAITWEPEGTLETPDEVLAAVNQVVTTDLGRFKALVETRGGGDRSR